MIAKLKSRFSKDIHFVELLKGSSVAFIIKIVGMGLGYIFTLLIAKYYGANTIGYYALSLTMLNIFTTISVFGLDSALVKFVADYNINNKQDLIQEVYTKALLITFTLSLVFSILFFLFSDVLAKNIFNNEDLEIFFKIASLAVIPYVLLKINSAMFRGLKKIKDFAFFDSTIVFMLTIIFFVAMHKLYDNKNIVIISQVIAIFIAFGLSYIVIKRYLRKQKTIHISLHYNEILKISFPMLLTSSLILIMGWTDILMLGIFKSENEVGVYSIIVKLAGLTSIVLVAINSIVAPKFSEFYSKNDLIGLHQIARKATIMIFVSTVPIILVLIIFAEVILNMFGNEFLIGITALWILMFGQFFNSITGPVLLLLNMTGHQKKAKLITVISVLMNICLNYFFIQMYGITGAALGTAISVIFWNTLLTIYVYNQFGFISLFNFNKRESK